MLYTVFHDARTSGKGETDEKAAGPEKPLKPTGLQKNPQKPMVSEKPTKTDGGVKVQSTKYNRY